MWKTEKIKKIMATGVPEEWEVSFHISATVQDVDAYAPVRPRDLSAPKIIIRRHVDGTDLQGAVSEFRTACSSFKDGIIGDDRALSQEGGWRIEFLCPMPIDLRRANAEWLTIWERETFFATDYGVVVVIGRCAADRVKDFSFCDVLEKVECNLAVMGKDFWNGWGT